jgi:hypothetical protein
MTRFLLTAAGLSFVFTAALVKAEPQANAPDDMKLTDDQCVMIWTQAEAADTVKAEPDAVPLDVVRPYVKDVTKMDPDKSGTVSTKEWADACKSGFVMTPAAAAPADGAPQTR